MQYTGCQAIQPIAAAGFTHLSLLRRRFVPRSCDDGVPFACLEPRDRRGTAVGFPGPWRGGVDLATHKGLNRVPVREFARTVGAPTLFNR